VDTEYGIGTTSEDLTALASARTMGDLSREDYLQEMKRRGILRNELSVSDNEDRLSTELA
jgi:molybdopterin-biosynthesis enzyme MoeA-like protein